jgi:chromosome segregation ATPase
MNSQNPTPQAAGKTLEERLNALEEKFNKMNTEVDGLKNERSELKENIKSMQDSFQTVNKNVETILSRLEDMTSRQNGSMMNGMTPGMMKMMRRPMRKLFVGTVSSVMTVTSVLTEAVSHMKEGMEDIMAEAQYEQKKKHMSMAKERNAMNSKA